MTQLILFILIGLFIAWVVKGYARYQEANPYRTQMRNEPLNRTQLEQSELGLFVALCAKVAKADGRVHELEAQLLGNMFSDISAVYPEQEKVRGLLKEIFNVHKQDVGDAERVAERLGRRLGPDIHKRRQMMAFLVHLAFVDGHLSRAEEQLLRAIAALLHLRSGDLENLLRQFAGMHAGATTQSSVAEAYALLGIAEDAEMETVKKAYRGLVKAHHPDIIKAQGASDAYIKEATEKIQQINTAYETIKKAREKKA